MKAIFLDIDGVLCLGGQGTRGNAEELEPDLVQNLAHLVNLNEAWIILTSLHRHNPARVAYYEDTFKEHGFIINRKTPINKHGRPAEIMHYVEPFKRHGMSHWVILDDSPLLSGDVSEDVKAIDEPDIADHFLRIDYNKGFDGQMLVRALQVLNSRGE